MKKYLKYIILIVILILLFSIPYIIKNIEKNDKIEPFLIENAQIEDITFNQNKINIYLFWGDGCPHCEELKEYFKSLEKSIQNIVQFILLKYGITKPMVS